jgi:serine/threonine-protein kinase
VTRWTPERWAEIKQAFWEVSEAPPDDRPALLNARTAADPELGKAVQDLLAQSGYADRRFEGGALRFVSPDADAGTGQPLWSRIGPYTVTRTLGRGGMGVVYEGTRSTDGGEERVAIKTLRYPKSDPVFARRFASEYALLSKLDHPNIARFVESGLIREGLPWFAMEFVDGTTIDAWCTAHRATVRERLALIQQACAAVQHAHDQGVIHRDLKPSNILVTPSGQVKLLDFGIARLLGGPDHGTLTGAGYRALSAVYASPEQVAGQAPTIESDVYSIGAVAYRLFAGRSPATASREPAERGGLVYGDDVPPPGEVLTDAFAQEMRAADRAEAIERMRPLQSAILTALAYRPDRRYVSARAFANALAHRASTLMD